MTDKNTPRPSKLSDYVQAFLDYLGRPKTVFDLRDRTKLVLLLAVTIIILQRIVQLLS